VYDLSRDGSHSVLVWRVVEQRITIYNECLPLGECVVGSMTGGVDVGVGLESVKLIVSIPSRLVDED
jgi:hypothetical protein